MINMPTTQLYAHFLIQITGNRQVNNGKLEEVCHRDGNTYVVMPLLWVTLGVTMFFFQDGTYLCTCLVCSCHKRALSYVTKLLPTYRVPSVPEDRSTSLLCTGIYKYQYQVPVTALNVAYTRIRYLVHITYVPNTRYQLPGTWY